MTIPANNGARTRHDHAKGAQVESEDGAIYDNRRQRNNGRQHNQAARAPDLNEPVVQQPDMGHFDAEGNFVSMDGGANGPSGKKNNNRRTPRQKKEGNQGGQQYAQPGGHGKRSPPRQAPANIAEHPAVDTPVKAVAYAGPTFHASPAPSALPMPKFFSKSVPSATNQPSLQARLENEQQEVPNIPSPHRPEPRHPVQEPPRNQESPLDLFFKADREEKARQTSLGAGNMTPQSKPNLPIPQTEPAQGNSWAQIYGNEGRRHSRHLSGTSGKEMFMMELDGNPNGQQARVQPKPERVPNNRSNSSPSHIPQVQNGRQQSFQGRQPHPTYGSPEHRHALPGVPATEPRSMGGSYQFDDQTASPFYRPGPQQYGTRSGGNTPLPLPPANNNAYAQQQQLHYGNRNLSPMFQAARQPATHSESPSFHRSSGLRQELSAEEPPRISGRESAPPEQNHQAGGNDLLSRLRALQPKKDPLQPSQQPSRPHSSSDIPPSRSRPLSQGNPQYEEAALNYLHSHLKQDKPVDNPSPEAQCPTQPIPTGIGMGVGMGNGHGNGHPQAYHQYSQQQAPQHLFPSQPGQPGVPSSAPPSVDVRSMEADLRRMLKLGGGPLGGPN